MKLLIDDEKLKAWAQAIRVALKVPEELNNPGGLLWHGQIGAVPSVPPVVGQPRPMAKFDTLEHGMGALYRELTSAINGDDAKSIPDAQWNEYYMPALVDVLPKSPTGALENFSQWFTKES